MYPCVAISVPLSFPTRRSSDLPAARVVNRLAHLRIDHADDRADDLPRRRSEEHRLNSSHLGISYAVFCLKKKRHCNNYTKMRGTDRTTRRRSAKVRMQLRQHRL